MSVQFDNAIETARQLLGCELLHRTSEGVAGGIIVEAEAYHSRDAASHTFRGQTPRNAAMFKTGGHIYVYFTYGMHYCVNIVTGKEGDGQGVLIRALEPTHGLELMMQRRQRTNIQELANGPAKLVQALGVTIGQSGMTLEEAGMKLRRCYTPSEIGVSPRRGISKAVDEPLRFYIAGNSYVS